MARSASSTASNVSDTCTSFSPRCSLKILRRQKRSTDLIPIGHRKPLCLKLPTRLPRSEPPAGNEDVFTSWDDKFIKTSGTSQVLNAREKLRKNCSPSKFLGLFCSQKHYSRSLALSPATLSIANFSLTFLVFIDGIGSLPVHLPSKVNLCTLFLIESTVARVR